MIWVVMALRMAMEVLSNVVISQTLLKALLVGLETAMTVVSHAPILFRLCDGLNPTPSPSRKVFVSGRGHF